MYLSQSFILSFKLVSYSFIIKEAMNLVKLNLCELNMAVGTASP